MKLTEKVRVQAQRNRAHSRGAIATLTLAEWEQTIADFNGMCAYCNTRPFIALEHFIPFGQEGDGTHVNNCLPACQPCNNLKKNRPLEVFAQKLGKETVERLQAYLANRTHQADKPIPTKPRRPRPPTPTLPEEIKRIRVYGGINGRKPQYGDEIKLQGEHGTVYRTVDWVTCVYHNFTRPNDYDVWLLPYQRKPSLDDDTVKREARRKEQEG